MYMFYISQTSCIFTSILTIVLMKLDFFKNQVDPIQMVYDLFGIHTVSNLSISVEIRRADNLKGVDLLNWWGV